MLVPDKRERRIRQLVREQGLCLNDIERILKIYDSFDTSGAGYLDREEFGQVLYALLKDGSVDHISEKAIDRYWQEVDKNFNGSIDFEEFLQWYMMYYKHKLTEQPSI